MAKIEFGKSVDVDLKVTLEVTYTQGDVNNIYKNEIAVNNGKASFVDLTIVNSGINLCFYSDSVSKSNYLTFSYTDTAGEVGKENVSNFTFSPDYSYLSFSELDSNFVEDGDGYKKFSTVLSDLLNKYNSVYTDYTCQFLQQSASGGVFNILEKINYTEYSNIKVKLTVENNTELPIFHGYKQGAWFGVPDLNYTCASTITEKTYTEENYKSMPVQTHFSYPYYRHYSLAHALFSDEFRKEPKPKQTFAENVKTNIQYDGSKKASLIISHHFNLEEYQNFTEETEVYKIPGYFINLAVNIRTVDPISGDNVNVYNLHKIDLPRDGFTKSDLVDDTGKSKSFTYTYGDLVKACNNTVLSQNMKISVDIIQFADAEDGSPYVIYTTPITNDIEINEIQHLYDSATPAGAIANSIEWSGYDGSDDGDNSSSDGKNDDKGDKSGGTGSGQGTHNVLTTTYVSNATRLQSLGDFLWSSGFLDNILLVNNNPIENVISVKMFPFALPTGEESTIVLGNVDTEVPTNKLPDNYNYYHVYGSITVPSYYNNFMDYAPFTRILLYLPFYGTLELDNSLVIDRTLKIAYIVDVVTGACTIDIYANDSLISVVSCQVGIDIPISSSNRAQVESAILTNTLTSAVSGASVGGGVGAVVGGVGGALMSAGHCKYNIQTSGAPSSATELYNVATPMLIIDRPKYREISGFAHNKGKMCMLTKKLNDVSGFSIFDENIDLSGVACTDSEQEILRNLLKTGIYL